MKSARELPEGVQLCPPSSHAVLPGSFTRSVMIPSYSTPSSTGERIFPINPQVPFLATHPSFLDIVGPAPKLELLAASADGRSFAHEAGVWIKETEEVFFVSNLYSEPKARNQISKIRLDALEKGRSVESSWDDIEPTGEQGCVTGNGATLYGDKLLWCSQGLGVEIPSALVVVDPTPPYAARPILNNFHGRPFNSINDVVVLPASAEHTTDRADIHHLPHTTIWFTDPTYGYAQHYKPTPELPNQVYCFNPTTGDVRVVADGFAMPNGLCFNLEGTKLYVTDTGVVQRMSEGENITKVSSRPATIYVFDVVRPEAGADLTAAGPTLHNRRVFAYADNGVPDGIKCDQAGNVYSGCGDGIHVWNSYGTLIGKILLPLDEIPTSLPSDKKEHQERYCANFNFVGNKVFIMGEDRIYVATLGEHVKGAL